MKKKKKKTLYVWSVQSLKKIIWSDQNKKRDGPI